MRTTRAITFAFATLVGAATIGGAQAPKARANGAPRADHAMGRAKDPHRGAARIFKGLTLSAAEKASVRQVHEKYRAQRQEQHQAQRNAQKQAMEQMRALRQKGDTAGARALIQSTRMEREKSGALMMQESAEIRAALSPANQAKYDANIKAMASRRGEQGEKHRKGGKHGKGQRGARGAGTNS